MRQSKLDNQRTNLFPFVSKQLSPRATFFHGRQTSRLAEGVDSGTVVSILVSKGGRQKDQLS
jgi:hypothetical protein